MKGQGWREKEWIDISALNPFLIPSARPRSLGGLDRVPLFWREPRRKWPKLKSGAVARLAGSTALPILSSHSLASRHTPSSFPSLQGFEICLVDTEGLSGSLTMKNEDVSDLIFSYVERGFMNVEIFLSLSVSLTDPKCLKLHTVGATAPPSAV